MYRLIDVQFDHCDATHKCLRKLRAGFGNDVIVTVIGSKLFFNNQLISIQGDRVHKGKNGIYIKKNLTVFFSIFYGKSK